MSQTTTQTAEATAQTKVRYENCAVYLRGMFGIQRADCRYAEVTTGVSYAQYSNAIAMEILENGKRKPVRRVLSGSDTFLVIIDKAHAIEPDSGMVAGPGGSRSRYLSYDPRYEMDFARKLKDVPVLADFRGSLAETEARAAEWSARHGG